MRCAARLKYGQTPYDRLSRKQLLVLLLAHHDALGSAASCLRMSRGADRESPYWSTQGSGGNALAKADYLRELTGENTDKGSEEIYHQFFRYGSGLLFPGVALRSFGPWFICETCGSMTSNGDKEKQPFKMCKCAGIWRPFTLADIRPDLANVSFSPTKEGSAERETKIVAQKQST